MDYCDIRIGEHGHVSDDFVDDVGFGSVIWVFDVSEVLGGAEEFKGESVEELSLAEDSVCRLDPEPSARVKIRRQLS